jgi:hypothetical protein
MFEKRLCDLLLVCKCKSIGAAQDGTEDAFGFSFGLLG